MSRPTSDSRELAMSAASLVATLASVLGVTAWRWTAGGRPVGEVLPGALVFAGGLLGGLLAHELGHYTVARWHGFRLSLPVFLPFPAWMGTLGAVIQLREEPRTRAGLLEMGAAGPLVGLAVVALTACVWLFEGAHAPVDGAPRFARPLLLWALAPLFGYREPPFPADGDPLGLAVAMGCLVTAMNLLPIGQLDGGHVANALAPRGARWLGWGTTLALIGLAALWPGWGVWAASVHLLGAGRGVEVRRSERRLPERSAWTAVAAALAFALTFTPVPFLP